MLSEPGKKIEDICTVNSTQETTTTKGANTIIETTTSFNYFFNQEVIFLYNALTYLKKYPFINKLSS